MNKIFLICARSGSKGLPGKNIKNLCGLPLIAHSILKAKEYDSSIRVVVSTDSIEIANIAKKYGAEIPFIRPAELAADNSPEWFVWQHALEFLTDRGEKIDYIVVLPVTILLRAVDDIKNCIDLYESNNFDSVITITSSSRSPYFNMVEVKNNTVNLLMHNSENKKIFRRQDAPAVYDMTTVAYVVKASFVRDNNGIFDGNIGYVMIPKNRAVDIDDKYDFIIAEALFDKGL